MTHQIFFQCIFVINNNIILISLQRFSCMTSDGHRRIGKRRFNNIVYYAIKRYPTFDLNIDYFEM